MGYHRITEVKERRKAPCAVALGGHAESRTETNVKTISDFIWQVPGENAEVDAYNLLLASLTNHDLWFNSVIEHQANMRQMGDVLAVVTAWLTLMYQNMTTAQRELMLKLTREVAREGLNPDKPSDQS